MWRELSAHRAVSFGLLMCAFAGCTTDPPPATDAGGRDAPGGCSADVDCDDGLFCSGSERCEPSSAEADARGCVRFDPPCAPSQRCSESEMRCITSCAVAPDADGDGVDAVECGGADCDDADPDRYPGNPEICDDSNHDEDCDPASFGDRDRDRDGHVDATCCNEQADGSLRCGDDCADQRRDVHPGLPEVCDGLDQDCDALIDEGATVLGWADEDHDLHGDPMSPREGCAGDPAFSRVADDCDDTNPARHGAQLEICDEVDNDCDERVDESPVSVPWYRDDDGDGFGSIGELIVSCVPQAGYALRARDCDDADPLISPAARERCNGLDDDCDGRADYLIAPGDTEDDDADGAADMRCGGADCDDARADVGPAAGELADGIDNDCDGVVDGSTSAQRWYLDRDGDGFGDEGAGFVESDSPVAGRVARGGDCDDGSSEVRPGVRDACGGADADCDGVDGDDDVRAIYFTDGDADGWGHPDVGMSRVACSPPSGFVAQTGDCDDALSRVHPRADETCDMVDEDCDTRVDEDSERPWLRDADGDGFGDDTVSVTACAPPAGHVATGGDCDDTRPSINPGRAELCDAADQDCDGSIDEGADATCAVLGGVGTCRSGACAVQSCLSGRGDCDASYSTGCEIDTARSAGHCGGCGMSCGLADTCGRTSAGMCDASPFVSLVGGGETAASFIALRSTGGAVGWGGNPYGQLGRGGAGSAPDAVALSDLAQVSLGSVHACGRTRDGRVYCWGLRDGGRLGDGGMSGSRSTPLPVAGITDAIDVAAGEWIGCALSATGSVLCWGARRAGATATPYVVPLIDDALAISVGATFACAMRPATGGGREVWCWGAGDAGECGGCTGCCSDAPRLVGGLPSGLVAFGEGSAEHMCVITDAGGVLCWGTGLQIGVGIDCGCPTPTPSAPPGLSAGVIAVAQSSVHDCAIVDRGATTEIWCWGGSDQAGTDGMYGDGPRARASTPVRAATTITDARAIAVGRAASGGTTCVLRATGEIYCFGANLGGALGNGGCATMRTDPTRPELPVCGIP